MIEKIKLLLNQSNYQILLEFKLLNKESIDSKYKFDFYFFKVTSAKDIESKKIKTPNYNPFLTKLIHRKELICIIDDCKTSQHLTIYKKIALKPKGFYKFIIDFFRLLFDIYKYMFIIYKVY